MLDERGVPVRFSKASDEFYLVPLLQSRSRSLRTARAPLLRILLVLMAFNPQFDATSFRMSGQLYCGMIRHQLHCISCRDAHSRRLPAARNFEVRCRGQVTDRVNQALWVQLCWRSCCRN